MTEIYHGPWDPVRGDTPGERSQVQDPYHPKYPAIANTEVRVKTDSQPVYDPKNVRILSE